MQAFLDRTPLVSTWRLGALLLVLGALLAPATAFAAEEEAGTTPATPTTTTTTTTTSGSATEKEEEEKEPKSETDDTWIAVAFIVFSGFSVLVLFVYLTKTQRQ